MPPLIDLFRVLRAGEELANAETWKKRQVLVNALTVLLSSGLAVAAAYGHAVAIDADGVASIAGAIAALVGVFNTWATVSTTERIGLSPGAGNPPPAGSDGGGYGGPARNVDGPCFYPDTDGDVPVLK